MQRDTKYIIIKKWISEELQDELFEHTRKLQEELSAHMRKIRSGKLIAPPPQEEKETILKINDRKKDKMYLVRKKETPPGSFVLIRR